MMRSDVLRAVIGTVAAGRVHPVDRNHQEAHNATCVYGKARLPCKVAEIQSLAAKKMVPKRDHIDTCYERSGADSERTRKNARNGS
jgi:hypothetical protein